MGPVLFAPFSEPFIPTFQDFAQNLAAFFVAAFMDSSKLDRINPVDLVAEMVSGASSCKELGDQSFAFFEVCLPRGIPLIRKPSKHRKPYMSSVTRSCSIFSDAEQLYINVLHRQTIITHEVQFLSLLTILNFHSCYYVLVITGDEGCINFALPIRGSRYR